MSCGHSQLEDGNDDHEVKRIYIYIYECGICDDMKKTEQKEKSLCMTQHNIQNRRGTRTIYYIIWFIHDLSER